MKIKLTIPALLLATISFSQDYSFVKGKNVNTKKVMEQTLPGSGETFYTRNSPTDKKYEIRFYENLSYVSSTYFTPVVDGKTTDYEGTYSINGKLYAFTSKVDKKASTKVLYAHPIQRSTSTSTSAKKIEGIPVATNSYNFKGRFTNVFNFQLSSDRSKLCINFICETEDKDDKGSNGYVVVDEDLKVLQKGSFLEDVFKGEKETILSLHVTQKGVLFLVTQNNESVGSKQCSVYKVKQNKVSSIAMDLGNKFLNKISVFEDEANQVIVSGLYGENSRNEKEVNDKSLGIFFMKINLDTETILNSGFNEFEEDFIVEGYSEKEREKANKNQEKKGQKPSLNNFFVRHLSATSDGGFMGFAEEKYTTRVNVKTDGGSYAIVTYYYKDIVAFKLDSKGNLVWKKKIQKSQISEGGSPTESSFLTVRKGDTYHLVFNDSKLNYDKSTKKFNAKSGEIINFNDNKTVVDVKINSKSGEIDRSYVELDKDLSTFTFHPQLSMLDSEDNSLTLFFDRQRGFNPKNRRVVIVLNPMSDKYDERDQVFVRMTFDK